MLFVATFGCGDDDAPPPANDAGLDATLDAAPDAGPPDPPAPEPFADVPETGRIAIPNMSDHAHVVFTEMHVPHIYAANRLDMIRVLGFVMARDRFFQMDMTRRLASGRVSEVLGELGLASDLENRTFGGSQITDIYAAALSAEENAELDAFAEGVNAYIAGVKNSLAPPPREYQIAAVLFGLRGPGDLMDDWTRRDVAATGATLLYATSFETGDVGRTSAFENVDTLFEGFPDRDLRRAGLQEDIIDHYAPPRDSSSAAGWGVDTAGRTRMAVIDPLRPRGRTALTGPMPERGVLDRLRHRTDRLVSRFNRDPDEGYGSNEWAVMGSATTDGSSILAGDGHLQLSVPALFWQVGLDTMLIGGASETTRAIGSTLPGLPVLGVGTNGSVAWTQTAYFADVTDWYAEEIVLDAAGMPAFTRFEGADRPITRIDETYVIRDIPALMSVGRTEMLARFATEDGRLITSIEGRTVTATEPLGPGESRINLAGDYIVPEDVDGDGTISGVSMYYGPFDGGSLLRAFRKFGFAQNVNEFRDAMRHFIGYGGSMAASDSAGSVFWSAYHSVPCRGYLPRGAGNAWIAGADPRRLLDGTVYPSWRIPLDAEGRVDETAAAAGGPTACAVPFDEWPQALDPARQYVHHANNDPGNITTDNDLFDDPFYIGGPWIEGYRAARIEERLQAAIAGGTADIAEMARIQGDHHSMLGEEWVPVLLEVIDAARTAAAGSPTPGSAEARIAARFEARRDDYVELETRMMAWREAGYPTPSGVETFYHTPAAGDAEHAVATSLFNAWFQRFLAGVLEDEGIPSSLSPAVTGDTFRMQTMLLLINGRGPGNPGMLGSYNPATEESVFFDDVRTPAVESSEEIGARAIDDALAYLESAPTAAGRGGYGTDDWSQWIWGLRHQVRFESLLGSELDDPSLETLLSAFNITTETLPLAPDLAMTDPRYGLANFPRPGDQFDIDAANPGLGADDDLTHGSGPVFRMVISLGPTGVRGQNILPGGQSGIPGDEHFADQVRLWLANETIPLRYLPQEVRDGAVSRERFVP